MWLHHWLGGMLQLDNNCSGRNFACYSEKHNTIGVQLWLGSGWLAGEWGARGLFLFLVFCVHKSPI